MPTPACLATASRLASAPPALNTALAASSTRSRLRKASARGFRDAASVLASVLASVSASVLASVPASVSTLISTLCVLRRIEMPGKYSPASMLLFEREFFGKSSISRSGHAVQPLVKRRVPPYIRRRQPGGNRRLPPRVGAQAMTIALIGALHEPLHQPHRERGAARDRASRPARDASRPLARTAGPDRNQERVRPRPMRRLHHPGRRQAHQLLPGACRQP